MKEPAKVINKQAASDLLCGLLDFIAGIPPIGSRPNLVSARESWIFEDDLLDKQAINREAQAIDHHTNRVARKC